MVSVRKRKKYLKKLYAESIVKNTIPKEYGDIVAHLMFHRYSGSLNNKKLLHSIEITFTYYDAYHNDYDSWDVSENLRKLNKSKVTNKKIKYNKYKFIYYDC